PRAHRPARLVDHGSRARPRAGVIVPNPPPSTHEPPERPSDPPLQLLVTAVLRLSATIRQLPSPRLTVSSCSVLERTAATNSLIRFALFLPGSLSTPLQTSTP